uniref:Uncharacterized protein n=1 Tax=Sus scrofa TaxID=9823 RepID=A0A8D0VX29_PIG
MCVAGGQGESGPAPSPTATPTTCPSPFPLLLLLLLLLRAHSGEPDQAPRRPPAPLSPEWGPARVQKASSATDAPRRAWAFFRLLLLHLLPPQLPSPTGEGGEGGVI